jgi:hypothetical protein
MNVERRVTVALPIRNRPRAIWSSCGGEAAIRPRGGGDDVDDVKGGRDARQTLPQSRFQIVNPCRASLGVVSGIRPRRHEGVAKAHW